MKGMEEIGWSATPSNGGMFLWAKYPFEMDDKEFVFKVIDQCGVVMVPGSIFGSEGAGYRPVGARSESGCTAKSD